MYKSRAGRGKICGIDQPYYRRWFRRAADENKDIWSAHRYWIFVCSAAFPTAYEIYLHGWNIVPDWNPIIFGAIGTLLTSYVGSWIISLVKSPSLIDTELQSDLTALRSRVESKEHTRSIRDELGKFLLEGQALGNRYRYEQQAASAEPADNWDDRVISYLQKELGPAYVARLRSATGITVPDYMVLGSQNPRLAAATYTRVVRLEEFLRELPPPV